MGFNTEASEICLIKQFEPMCEIHDRTPNGIKSHSYID